MRGAKHIPLFVGVEMVILPPHRILAYIFYMFFIVLTASDHVVIEASLPNVFAILLVAKALKCRYKLRTNLVRSLNICRDSPRLSAPFVVTFSTDRMVSVGDCFLREDDILPYGSLFTSFPSARVILEWSRPTGFFALLKNDSVGRRSEGSRADCFR